MANLIPYVAPALSKTVPAIAQYTPAVANLFKTLLMNAPYTFKSIANYINPNSNDFAKHQGHLAIDRIFKAMDRGYDLNLIEEDAKFFEDLPYGYLPDIETGEGDYLNDGTLEPFQTDVFGRYGDTPAANTARQMGLIHSHPRDLLNITHQNITNNPFVSKNPITNEMELSNLYKMLRINAPNLTSAISEHEGLLPGIAESINNGYDLGLLEEDFNELNEDFKINRDDPWSFYDPTDAVTNFDRRLNHNEFLKSYDPYQNSFPSDNNSIIPYNSDAVDPSKLRKQIIEQPNIVDWYRKIMSETQLQPATQSAINMLIANPNIGLRRR